MTHWFVIRVLGLAMVLGLFLSGCAGGSETSDRSTIQQIKERGTLDVGMNAAYPPFEFRKGGKIVGFDPDLIKILAKSLGVKPNMIDTDWGGVIPSLYAGKFDTIISAMTVTEERADAVLFTQPYAEATMTFLTREDRSDIRVASDLEGKVIATQGGSAGQTAVEAWQNDGHSFKDVKYFQDMPLAYEALQAGRVDAVVDALPTELVFMKSHPGYKTVPGFGPKSYFAIAVRKDSADLCRAFDNQLTKLKENGKLAELQEKWFGNEMTTPDAPPRFATHC